MKKEFNVGDVIYYSGTVNIVPILGIVTETHVENNQKFITIDNFLKGTESGIDLASDHIGLNSSVIYSFYVVKSNSENEHGINQTIMIMYVFEDLKLH